MVLSDSDCLGLKDRDPMLLSADSSLGDSADSPIGAGCSIGDSSGVKEGRDMRCEEVFQVPRVRARVDRPASCWEEGLSLLPGRCNGGVSRALVVALGVLLRYWAEARRARARGGAPPTVPASWSREGVERSFGFRNPPPVRLSLDGVARTELDLGTGSFDWGSFESRGSPEGLLGWCESSMLEVMSSAI